MRVWKIAAVAGLLFGIATTSVADHSHGHEVVVPPEPAAGKWVVDTISYAAILPDGSLKTAVWDLSLIHI